MEDEPLNNEEEVEKIKKIGIIGAYFLPADESKKDLAFAVGAQVLGILRDEPGGKAYAALPERLKRWKLQPN